MKLFFFLILWRFLRIVPFSEFLFNRIKKKISLRYGLLVQIEAAGLYGIRGVSLKNLAIEYCNKGHSISIERLKISVELRCLLRGEVKLTQITADRVQNHISPSQSSFNVNDSNIVVGGPSPGNLLNRLCFMLDAIPESINLNNSRIRLPGTFNNEIAISTFALKGGEYSLEGNLVQEELSQKIGMRGTLVNQKGKYEIQLIRDTGHLILNSSLSKGKTQLQVGTFSFKFAVDKFSRDQFKIVFDGGLENMSLVSDIISTSKVANGNAKLHLQAAIDKKGIQIEDASYFMFNQVKLFFQLTYVNDKTHAVIKAKILSCSISEILQSFRNLKYHSLYARNLLGGLSLFASFSFRPDNPKSNHFKVKVNDKISFKPGNEINLKYLNYPFKHTILSDGKKLREIDLSEKNDSFSPFSSISANIKKVILSTEDRNFYKHNGFDEFYLGHSIVANFLERKIVRGGSTLTMQLARNLFLNHERNIFRKLEEVFFTYLMESVFSIDKDRIYEIYLNIIEFGPNIYGIAEATQFYFSKRPGDISLKEALVISYIIPRPKFFLEALELNSPTLLVNLKKHMVSFSTTMLKRGLISEAEFNEIDFEIKFARELGTLRLQEVSYDFN